jgi:Domain of unknown function (DUF4476)
MMKNILLALTICLIMFNQTSAQSRLNIKSSDTLDFVLSIGGNDLNIVPCLNIGFNHNYAGKTNVTARFPNCTQQPVTAVLNLAKNSSAFYELLFVKGTLKFVLTSESSLEPSTKLIRETQTIPLAQSDPATAGLAVDTSQAIEINAGCSTAITEQEYIQLKTELKAIHFESRKLDLMTQFCSAHCLRVEQMRYLLSQLEMEDNKISLLRTCIANIYDISRISQFEDDFFLEKNKVIVREIIVQNKP